MSRAPELRHANYTLCVLVLVYILNFVDRQILSILAEEIKADLGLSDATIGFLYGTAFAVFYAIFGIPLARLADVWVRTRLIAIGLFLLESDDGHVGHGGKFCHSGGVANWRGNR